MPEQLIFALIPDALPYSAADLRRDPDCYSFVLEAGSLPQCLLSKLSKTSVSMVSFLKENMLSFVAFSSQLLKGPLDRKEKKVNFYLIESPELFGKPSKVGIGDPDPFSQRYGSGSFPFLINVLSRLE